MVTNGFMAREITQFSGEMNLRGVGQSDGCQELEFKNLGGGDRDLRFWSRMLSLGFKEDKKRRAEILPVLKALQPNCWVRVQPKNKIECFDCDL